MTKLKTVAILSMLMICGLAGTASAQIFTGFYDFTDTQYTDDFTDVRRGPQINSAPLDLGGTGQSALNFTGHAGPAGDTWLTKWTPAGAPSILNGRCGTSVAAFILTHPFDNRKGAGVVALLNDANPGDKGLAVILYDNGNSDAIQLATIDPLTGKLSPLKTVPLFARIREDGWYVVFMDLTVELAFDGDDLIVDATVLSLQDPTDANSDLDRIVGSLRFKGPLGATGLQPEGQVGIMASATGAVVDSSVTYWIAAENFEGPCSE
jgi:hypothetical protein